MERGATNQHADARGRSLKDPQAALKRSRPFRALAAAILIGGPVAAVMFLPGVKVDSEGPVDPPTHIPSPSRFRTRTSFLSVTSTSILKFVMPLRRQHPYRDHVGCRTRNECSKPPGGVTRLRSIRHSQSRLTTSCASPHRTSSAVLYFDHRRILPVEFADPGRKGVPICDRACDRRKIALDTAAA